MIRVAILGIGAMGRSHAAAYAALPGVEVAGISNARDSASASALIADGTIDAVDVCLPTTLHSAFVVAALEAGKHVFCETPLALDLDTANRMRGAARGAGRLLQVGLLMRSVAAYVHLEAAVRSGEHGKLLGLSTFRLGSYLRPDAPGYKPHYGDPTTELMTFDFDVAHWLLGKPLRLSATAGGEVTALLDYGDGRSASITASGLMPAGFPFTVGFRALFERAAFELRTVFENVPPRSTFTLTEGHSAPRVLAPPGGNPYEIELRRFIDCIEGRADAELLDVDRAIEALTLSLATQCALAERRTVSLA